MKISIFAEIAASALMASPAMALDPCKSVALYSVKSIEDSSSVLRKGEITTRVTQFVRDNRGRTSYCAHGDYCYPATTIVGGKKVEAIKLLNCTVNLSSGERDDDGSTTYYLRVDPTRNSPHDMKVFSVADRLTNLGASDAISGTLAYAYVDRPNSTCGRFAGAALRGDRRTLSALMDGDVPC